MEISSKNSSALKGGEWLIKESNPFDIFIPENITEEQKMILGLCRQFMDVEVLPNADRIEQKEPGLVPALISKAGEYGLLSATIPEEYGGLGKDFMTAAIITQGLGHGYSFSVSLSCHTGIGSLPILYFGTDEQRSKYIPNLATGEWKGAYGLTEPGSGSDALGAKTTATLSADGKYYLLNGQKCWITNGGFADVYTIFAKIDGDKFTAFIVERGTEGFTQGPEEKKMGLNGSSTVQLYFQDCKVPAENLLGEVGRGHVIAFNILNIGRYKMAAGTSGAAKSATNISLRYALAREQFKTPIANFGAIKHKLAEMAIRIWACESAVYRVGQYISDKEEALRAAGETFAKSLLGAAEEYAGECAMLKIFGSEMLSYVVDEGIQIHGGNGFSDEYEISRAYRDNRIDKIFEGTNEINRMLFIDMLLKRAMKGTLDIMPAAIAVSKELMSIPEHGNNDSSAFAEEKKYVNNFKKAVLMVMGAAVQKLKQNLATEQEIMMHIADMAIYSFISESALLRLMRLAETQGKPATVQQADIVRTFIFDAATRINKSGKDAINAFADGDEMRMLHIGLTRFTKTEPFNAKAARRRIAEKMMEEKSYCF